ncbi:MAG: hypothetical protein IIA87_03575 [Nanoarchaeota archaeon]|nr:hypothetical protein [Nanoarchaeota archaeon]
MKAQICPVCIGKGKIGFEEYICHGCYGKGWVEVNEETYVRIGFHAT